MLSAIIVLMLEIMILVIGIRQIFYLENIRPTEKIIPKADKDVGKVW